MTDSPSAPERWVVEYRWGAGWVTGYVGIDPADAKIMLGYFRSQGHTCRLVRQREGGAT